MRYTLITQVALITISLVIVFTFIKPLLGEIKTTQDEIFLYEDAVDKATQFNDKLQSLIAKRDAFSDSDRTALDTFIPTKIDSLKVMRDIEGIFASIRKPIISLSSTEIVKPQENDSRSNVVTLDVPSDNSIHQDFDVTFVGDYYDLKNVLEMLNKNETLLEVMELSFEKVDTAVSDENKPTDLPKGLFIFHLMLRTFAIFDPSQTSI